MVLSQPPMRKGRKLALNRNGKGSLARMNRFARRSFRRMNVDATRPVQDARFIGSYTSLRRKGGEDGQCGRILPELGIDLGTFVTVPARPEEEADHIFILRHTLMNPFLTEGPCGRSHIDMYCAFWPRPSTPQWWHDQRILLGQVRRRR